MTDTVPGRCPSCFELIDAKYSACGVCSYPHCHPHHDAIDPGTVLNGRYVLGFGQRDGGSMRYYAWDTEALRRVRIVELFIDGCVRGGMDGTYLLGLPYGSVDSFLKKIDGEPLEIFRANGTAYLVYFDPEVYSQRDLDRQRPYHMSMFHCPFCLSRIEPGSACGFCGSRDSGICGGLPEWTVLAGKYMVGRLLCCEGDANIYPALTLPTGEAVLVREYAPRYVERGGDGLSMELLPCYAGTDAFMRGASDFLRRASAISKLSGPGLPGPAKLFWENRTCYAVTPYFPAVPLRQYLSSHGPLAPGDALGLLRDVFDAVWRLDEAGLFHTGLSPEAITVTAGGRSILISPVAGYVIGSAPDDGSPVEPRPYSEPFSSEGPSAGSDVFSMAAIYLSCRIGRALPVDFDPAKGLPLPPGGIGREEAGILARALSPDPNWRHDDVRKLYYELAYAIF